MTCLREKKKKIIHFELQQLDTKVDDFPFIYWKTSRYSKGKGNLCFCHIKEVSMPYLCKALFENTINRSAPSKTFQSFFQVFLPKGCMLLQSFPQAPQFSNGFHSLHSHLNHKPKAGTKSLICVKIPNAEPGWDSLTFY